MMGLTYQKAVENADALKAIGQTTIYLSKYDGNDDDSMPWDLVDEVTEGNTLSYIGPRAVNFNATHQSGLQFHWSIDLGVEGSNVERRPFFDHSRIVAMAARLSPENRAALAAYFEGSVLPPLRKQIAEARQHLNALLEGETTLLGIVASIPA